MKGAQAIARALTPSRVNCALRARKKWAHQMHHVQKSALSLCHERSRCRHGHMRLQRDGCGTIAPGHMYMRGCLLPGVNLESFFQLGPPRKKSQNSIRGAVHHQSHGSSSPTAEQTTEL
eukprot:6211967-Pleurochrysis_carterae.AAC.1